MERKLAIPLGTVLTASEKALVVVVAMAAVAGNVLGGREGMLVPAVILQACLMLAALHYRSLLVGPAREPSPFIAGLNAAAWTLVAGAFCVIVVAAHPDFYGNAAPLLRVLVGATLTVALWRSVSWMWLARGIFQKSVLVVGDGPVASEVTRELRTHESAAFRFMGTVTDAARNDGLHARRLGAVTELSAIIARHGTPDIIVLCSDARPEDATLTTLLNLKMQGVEVEDGVNFFERMSRRLLVKHLSPENIAIATSRHGLVTSFIKRSMDLFIAGLGLVLTAPLIAVAAVAVKLESPGTAFFTQERVGQGGRTFKLFKIRTMRNDSEKNGAAWAKQNDARITRIGGFLRRTRIDELPQFWNVLNGDMSVVGPRPEQPKFVAQLETHIPGYSYRHLVRPGITGNAQVFQGYTASVEETALKVQYDLSYVRNYSVRQDLDIMLRTFAVLLLGLGAR